MIDHSIRVPQFHPSLDHGVPSIVLVAITIPAPLDGIIIPVVERCTGGTH